MQKTNKFSFDDIANEIINNNKFDILKEETHHGISRYSHIMRVSKWTYKISSVLNMDYISATRAALLHDYFTNNDYNELNRVLKLSYHPTIALNNAIKDFNINEKEVNAITSHMFPMGNVMPKYKESWVLTVVDKSVAIYELSRFKLKYQFATILLFIFNMFMFGHH